MNFIVIKILAIGSYLRFMWIELPNGRICCLRINDDLYHDLKFFGVPTSQSLRGKKNER